MPHKTDGEGLFLAVFKKPTVDETEEEDEAFLYNEKTSKNKKRNDKEEKFLRDKAQRKDKFKNYKEKSNKDKKEEIPSIEQILSSDYDQKKYPMAELTKEQALQYLRRESLSLPKDTPKGYIVAGYKGLPLGLMKNIGERANNLYPKNWRILMDTNQI